jgi:HEAT repeat protein
MPTLADTMKKLTRIAFAVVLLAILCIVAWLFLPARDPLFQGKPESAWITNIVYNGSDEQTKQWQDFGTEGVRVLVRGLNKARHPLERSYRNTYRKLSSKLPGGLLRLLPDPRADSGRATRMSVVELVAKLGIVADIATPAMARTLEDDEPSIRQLAINYFTDTEDEHCRLNRLEKNEKKKLLPSFIRDAQDSGNWGLRNNAVMALRYYPEQREAVTPVLQNALNDKQPQVRLVAADALNHVAPDTIMSAKAVPAIIEDLKNPDDQIAYRAARLLGEMRQEPSLAVPALIEAAACTNNLVAGSALWALGQYPDQAKTIEPALLSALKNPSANIRHSAADALKKIDPAAAAQAGVK